MGSEGPVGRQSGESKVEARRASRTEPQPDQRLWTNWANCVCGTNGGYRADVASFKLTLKSGNGRAATIRVPAFFLCRGLHRSQ